MPEFNVHLVGGVPLSGAEEVFRVASEILGPALPRIPDGEVGRRWMAWFAPIITENPGLRATDEVFRPHPGGDPSFRYVLAPGRRAEDVTFTNLRHAEITLESYAVFKRLKQAGAIAPGVRFQVTLAHPIPIVRRYFPDELQAALEPALESALLGELRKICEAISHSELAIQWDCASAIFATLEIGEPSRFGHARDDMYGPLATRLARLGAAVPEGVDLIYHFCYGNSRGKHSVEPSSTRDAVAMANRITALLAPKRAIQLIHLPVPKDRHDDAYFEPLRRLEIFPQTTMALGLVHLSDGVPGTRRRIDAARKYLPRFAIGTECGLSHVPGRDAVLATLRLQAQLAGVA